MAGSIVVELAGIYYKRDTIIAMCSQKKEAPKKVSFTEPPADPPADPPSIPSRGKKIRDMA